jgi:hypothetical protein
VGFVLMAQGLHDLRVIRQLLQVPAKG